MAATTLINNATKNGIVCISKQNLISSSLKAFRLKFQKTTTGAFWNSSRDFSALLVKITLSHHLISQKYMERVYQYVNSFAKTYTDTHTDIYRYNFTIKINDKDTRMTSKTSFLCLYIITLNVFHIFL